ncbi:MAG: hypothetical protein ACXAEU_24735, partial [Candidatus Hodarchaeales archaeon]
MIRNRNRKSDDDHYLPKCPKTPPQGTRFDVLGQFSQLKHLITALLIVLLLIGIVSGIPTNSDWNQIFGGENFDVAHSLIQTADGGYALVGITESFSHDHEADCWLVKTDARGQVEWTKTFGDPAWASANSLIQTVDGGYALAGSIGGYWNVPKDIWLVKMDASGQVEWNQTYGGLEWNQIYGGLDEYAALIQTADGGYALAATRSYGAGDSNFWLVKTDARGQAEWNQTYGGSEDEYADALIQTADGGYALAGATKSYGAGDSDFWLVKTDARGQAEWNKTFGGEAWETASSLIQTADGGYTLAGGTESYGAGGSDIWLVK